MDSTYFDTFLRALEDCPEKQGVLGKEQLIFPPDPDFGYHSTPRNALTFGTMGVDGVHYAILTIDGAVSDESPVIQICPMDFSDLYQVLGGSFLTFLADACGVPISKMEAIFAAERAGEHTLVPFLKERFDMERLWVGSRSAKLERYLEFLQRKP